MLKEEGKNRWSDAIGAMVSGIQNLVSAAQVAKSYSAFRSSNIKKFSVISD